jgi:hypothetical protein
MPKIRIPISASVAIGTGLLVLISLMIPGLETLRERILGWTILLAAVALIIGLFNLFRVHFDHVRRNQRAYYSFVLLLGMVVSFIITLLQGRAGNLADWLFNYVQFPVESSLMALLAITLTLSVTRLVQTRSDFNSLFFAGTLFIILLGSGPLFGLELPILTRTVAPYIRDVLAIGAIRGLLIGVALGTIATAIRILIGAERPFEG